MNTPTAIGPTIPELFEAAVAAAGDRPALVDAEGSCSFSELDRWANGIAHAAALRATSPGRRACILTDSAAASTAALLGLCKGGMTSLRPGTDQPLPYLRSIVADAEPEVILTTAKHRSLAESLCGEGMGILDLHGECPGRDDPPGWKPAAGDRTSINYTSGSTGRPKGVVQTHRSVLAFMANYLSRTGLDSRDRVAVLHDSRAMDMLAALMAGATVCHFPLASGGFLGFADWLRDNRITVLPTVPSVLRYMVRALAGRGGLRVRLLRLSGEALAVDDVRRAATVFPGDCRVLNWFGSTEVAVASSSFYFREANELSAIPPLTAFDNVEVRITDPQGMTQDANRAGEIVVSGACLFDGYWRRPDLDEQRLSVDPDRSEVRRFRTGDMGYLEPNGGLVVLGRGDHQVKVNGYRVEPQEVEAALRSIPGIDDALVRLVNEDGNGGGPRRVLAAYVVVDAEQPPAVTFVRRRLAAKLPRYMVPAYFVRMDRLPTLEAGKPDREALPDLVPVTRHDYNFVSTHQSKPDEQRKEHRRRNVD